MKEARYFYVPDAAGNNELPGEEALHALRVLRLKAGDEMFLMDGKGVFYRAAVSMASNKHCLYEIKETLPQEKSWNGHIHIAMAPTKMTDRVEWMAEKATEIGVDEITITDCAFSGRKSLRTDRLDKIVVSAMKQSRKPWKPVVNGMTDFRTFVTSSRGGRKYIAHCYEEIHRVDLAAELGIVNAKIASGNTSAEYERTCSSATPDAGDITIMIGPEGDFSVEEVRLAISAGYVPVSLCSSRLRTETAAVYAVMLAQLSLRKQNS